MEEETIKVRVRDRSAEAPWGSGLTRPVVRTVEISAFCQVALGNFGEGRCGRRRGEPASINQCDDGEYYSVDIWDNPCGHVDPYEVVVAEARELAAARQASR